MDNPNHNHEEEGDRCVICGRFFRPQRLGDRQKTCLDPECRRQRKRAQEKAWLERWHKDHGTSYFSGDYDRIRDWREANPGYQRRWRAKRRREIHNAQPPVDPIKPVILRLRISPALRFSEIQTLNLRLTRSGSDFLVDGYP
jgi:hypothetical protein